MKVKVVRTYTIDYTGTAADFIQLVHNHKIHAENEGLDSMDMGDATIAATYLFDGGDLTSIVDQTDEDTEILYIDCDDKSTLLDENRDGTFFVRKYTDQWDFEIVAPAARELAMANGPFDQAKYQQALADHYGY